ncbi:hypothetical protein DPMN_027984 [Dreissena polymorpha]|uniref:Uncharacterized protein n=1 Tax=Dreissena polymorpha TaxID=45954 RepID=A0A9D4LVT8_DREPO|nr:hypothetical protein DPMN_027984 [Dreissena polymorpha]
MWLVLLGLNLTVLSRPVHSNNMTTNYSYPITGHSRRATAASSMGPLGLCPVSTAWTETDSHTAY